MRNHARGPKGVAGGVERPRSTRVRFRSAAGRWVLSWEVLAVACVLFVLAIFPTVASAGVSYDANELRFLQLINDYRQQNGLQPLLLSDMLSDCSTKHSHDMGTYGFFSHDTVQSDWFPAGATPWVRMAQVGYTYNTTMGENIAAGYSTADAVFTAWKNSPEHNANMLTASFKVIGIGLEYIPGSQYGYYWTTDFGGYVDPTAHPGGSTTPTPPDTTPPTVSFARPAPGATLSGTVQIEVVANDNVGVTKVELYANNQLAATASGGAVFNWDTSTAADGDYTIRARAYDAAGNTQDATITVTVRNTPTTTIPPSTTTTLPVTTTTTPPPTTTTTGPPTTTTTRATTTTTTVTSPPPVTTTTARVPPPPATTTTTQPPQVATFSDVPSDYVFAGQIYALVSRGVIGGYPDGTYRPDDPVTRAQFAKIIVLALGRQPLAAGTRTPTFYDVPFTGALYPFGYVETAVDLGIITGYGDGTFRPDNNMTRAQLALMLVRAAGNRLAVPPPYYSDGFTDVPDFAADAVRTAKFNGILSGTSSTTFSPDGQATRGQVAKMTENLMTKLGL